MHQNIIYRGNKLADASLKINTSPTRMADYVNIPFRLPFFEEEKLPIITAPIFRAEVSKATIDSIPRIVCVRKGNEVSAFNEHSLKGPSSRHTQMHFNDLAAGEMYRIGLSTFVSQFP